MEEAEEWFVYTAVANENPPQEETEYKGRRKSKYTKENELFKCLNPGCNSKFTRPNNLRRHMNFVCRQEPKRKCPHCDYVTKRTDHVRQHCFNKHPELEPGFLELEESD